VIVEKKGKPMAVMNSPDEDARYQHAEEERLWHVVERLQERNTEKDPADVRRDVTEAVEDVRQERWEQRTRTTPRRRCEEPRQESRAAPKVPTRYVQWRSLRP
jgi:hypothetical protein